MKLSEWLAGKTHMQLVTRGMSGLEDRGVVPVEGFVQDADAESDPELSVLEDNSVSFSNGFVRFYLKEVC